MRANENEGKSEAANIIERELKAKNYILTTFGWKWFFLPHPNLPALIRMNLVPCNMMTHKPIRTRLSIQTVVFHDKKNYFSVEIGMFE